jgi:hypothetical protein
MKDKAQALQRLSAIEAEAAALRKIIDEPEAKGLWKPEPEQNYWRTDPFEGSVYEDRSVGFTGPRIRHGNCFPSREIAEKAAPLMARANKIIAACLQADPESGPFIHEDREIFVTFVSDEKQWVVRGGNSYRCMHAYMHTWEQGAEAARILNFEGVK